MSTDLITYLNFIAGLENATDDQIKDIMAERTAFIAIGKSEMMAHCDRSINTVFDKIDSLAKQLEEEQIAQESVKLAEDAAAVGAIWSFGLSLAAFAALAATDIALEAAIKKKEEDLNKHLASADQDIADKMGGVCEDYVNAFKKNNSYIKASSPAGLTPQTARSYLYNYMDFISTHGGVNLANFKKYIEVARMTKNDKNINRIYVILDDFTLSNKSQKEMQDALKKINASGINTTSLVIIRGFTYAIWICKMNVSPKELGPAAERAGGIPPEEAEASVFENMDTIGKVTAALTIVISIVDAVLNVYNIVETIERYRASQKIYREARGQYKDYYKKLHDASVKYKAKS